MAPPRPADPVAPDDPHAPSKESPEGVAKWPFDQVAERNASVDRYLERAAEPDRVLTDRAVWERQPQDRGARIGPGADLDHLGGDQLVHEPPALVDDEEPAILGDARRPEHDLVACFEAEAPDRGDVEAGDVRHAAMLLDNDIADAEGGPFLEPEHVKDERRLDAFDARSPAVLVVVLERFPIWLEGAELDVGHTSL